MDPGPVDRLLTRFAEFGDAVALFDRFAELIEESN